MSVVVELARTEERIGAAVKAHGDKGWDWYGTKANPNVVPLLWNDICVYGSSGDRYLSAADYVAEVEK